MSFIFAGGIVFCLGDYLGIVFNLPTLFWQIFISVTLISSIATFFFKSGKEAYLGFATLFLFTAGGLMRNLATVVPANHISNFTEANLCVQGEIIPGTVKKRDDGTINLQLIAKVVKVGGKNTPVQGIIKLSVSKFSKN